MEDSHPAASLPNQVKTPIQADGLIDVATRTGVCPELAGQFLPGAAKDRMVQYFARLMPPGVGRLDLNYWNSFVEEFYVPNGTMRMLMMNEDTRDRNRFDIASEFLPQFFALCFSHNMRVMRMQFTEMREYTCDPTHLPASSNGSYESSYPLPLVPGGTTHIVESSHMLFLIVYKNGWQGQMIGMFRALLVPYTKVRLEPAPPGVKGDANGKVPRLHTTLRVQYLCFSTLARRLYVPFEDMMKRYELRVVPQSIVEEIMSYAVKRERDTIENGSEGRASKRLHVDDAACKTHAGGKHDQSCEGKTPTSQPDSDQPPNETHIPRFALPPPRLSLLQYFDGHGFPAEMGPIVAVRMKRFNFAD